MFLKLDNSFFFFLRKYWQIEINTYYETYNNYLYLSMINEISTAKQELRSHINSDNNIFKAMEGVKNIIAFLWIDNYNQTKEIENLNKEKRKYIFTVFLLLSEKIGKWEELKITDTILIQSLLNLEIYELSSRLDEHFSIEAKKMMEN